MNYRIIYQHITKLILLAVLFFSFNLDTFASSIKIPFKYVQSFIILDIKLENIIPLKLIFDTGAEYNLLFNRTYTDLIKDAYLREVKIMGSDLSVEIPALLTQS
ncbi:MAG: hypothetical protein ABIO44_11075, partial [Saprospiraceae bacterium]